MGKRQKRTFAITRGQIFLTLLAAVVALTIVYEIGVSRGKEMVVEAERAAAQKSNALWNSPMPSSDKPSEQLENAGETLAAPKRGGKPKSSRQNNVQARAITKAPTGGDLPMEPPQDESMERPQAERGIAQYTIQVGAFSSYQNAENMVALLKSYEYKSWLRVEPPAERQLYSVFVGGFSTRDEAKRFGETLKNRLSFVTSYMAREIQK